MKGLLVILCFLSRSITGGAQTTSPADSIQVYSCRAVETEALPDPVKWDAYLDSALQNIFLDFQPAARNYGMEVRFVIDKTGRIIEVKVDAKNEVLAKAIEKIFLGGPSWKPASRNGRPVKAFKKEYMQIVVETPADL